MRVPCRTICWGLIPFRLAEGGEKSRYGRGDFGGAEHADLDAGGWKIGDQVIESVAEEGWVGGLDLGYALSGLHGKGGNDAGAEESVGCEGLEVGGDAGAAGGIVASDGEERARSGGLICRA